MAYFSNGSEGEFYEAALCSRCVHYQLPDGYNICPVWELHMLYNYDQNKDEGLEYILNTLIPRHGVHNDLCSMWHPSEPEFADHGKNYQAWLEGKD